MSAKLYDDSFLVGHVHRTTDGQRLTSIRFARSMTARELEYVELGHRVSDEFAWSEVFNGYVPGAA